MPITPDSPCHERWSALSPNGDGRYCQKCEKTVVDLTQLTRRQAEKLVVKAGGAMCGRMRLDPSGAPAFRREIERAGLLSVAAAGLLAACGSNPEDSVSSSTTHTAASVESSGGGDHVLGEGAPTSGSIVMLPLADDRDLLETPEDTSTSIAAFSVDAEDTGAVTPTDDQLLLTEAKDEARRPTSTAATHRRPRTRVDRPTASHPPGHTTPPVTSGTTGRRNNGGSVSVAPSTPLPAVNNPPDTMVYMGGISYTP